MFLPPAQVKQRRGGRKSVASRHGTPLIRKRGAEKDYDKAKAELDAEDKNIATLNSRIASTEGAPPVQGLLFGSR
ncbi:hypothetical protein [Klebsiella pneumoniae]|uniref:hypothetical protein n=1 Tax=Klebsiella pneumoniae TaxID=573 RepID=UPI002234CD51|nr:hypothetical protein [Klebsiella pneumoniae]